MYRLLPPFFRSRRILSTLTDRIKVIAPLISIALKAERRMLAREPKAMKKSNRFHPSSKYCLILCPNILISASIKKIAVKI
jgi:hypothetical protein